MTSIGSQAPAGTAVSQPAPAPVTIPSYQIRTEPAQSPPGAARRQYALVLLLAGVVRAAWGLLVPVIPISDSIAYDTFARNLAASKFYGWDGVNPSAYWPVGAPFMYSLVYRVFHPESWGYGPTVAVNWVIGMAVVALTMALARRWFDRPVALAAGILMALWPWHVQFTTILASESIFTALCLAGMLVWPTDRKGVVPRAIVAGFILAAATYVRPTALLIPAVLAVAGVLKDRDALGGILRVAFVYTVIAACLAPWAYRNHQQIGQFTLVSTNGGPNLWMGNNPQTTGFYQALPPQPEGMTEAQFHKQLGQEAVGYIRAHPVAFVKRTIIKAVRLYERETIGVGWNEKGLLTFLPAVAVTALKAGSQAFWLAALVAGVAGGIILTARQGLVAAALHPVVLIPAYFTGVHAVIVIQDRYHFPMTPMVAVLAAVALLRGVQWARDRRARTAPAA